jgi:glycosyltransferase involved in cell wall biosynthesis
LKIACVIHRFGADIAGGSEAHCRGVALQLAASHDVTVLTTCARDHISWRNTYPAGESTDGPLRIRRFPVARQRSMARFGDLSEVVFAGQGSESEEEQWFRENGPESPALIDYLATHGAEFDRVLFWAFRYYPSYFGVPTVPGRAVLVPTAEDDPVVALGVVSRLFTRTAGFVFVTPEEQALVARHCPEPLAPSCVIGIGLEPASASVRRERGSFDANEDRSPRTRGSFGANEDRSFRRPFLLYLGRVDPNKGCDTLFRHFVRWQAQTDLRVPLVLAGPANMPVPDHPLIKFLGYVDDATREALLAQAALLVMPSRYESLSIVLLEAWNHGTAALVNGDCDVLQGHALRSDGALYYRNFDEFAHALEYLLRRPELAAQLGQQGLAYVEREYRWPKVIQKLETFLAEMQPL